MNTDSSGSGRVDDTKGHPQGEIRGAAKLVKSRLFSAAPEGTAALFFIQTFSTKCVYRSTPSYLASNKWTANYENTGLNCQRRWTLSVSSRSRAKLCREFSMTC